MAENTTPQRGLRKDGQAFKEGNTRADGSFAVGKNRPPEQHRFRENDGRQRGRREKGKKNLLTEWREELDTKIEVTEGGKKKKLTKRRTVIKSQIDRAMKQSDRAAENVLRYAELSEKRDPGLQSDDHEIIEAWLAEQLSGDSDDGDAPGANERNGASGDGVTGDA